MPEDMGSVGIFSTSLMAREKRSPSIRYAMYTIVVFSVAVKLLDIDKSS
jgi:hypothetical protein